MTESRVKRRRSVFQGKIIDIGVETVALPNGQLAELEIVRHPGGAAAVALDDDGKVCLLRQYRHAAGGWLWELPAGKTDFPRQNLRSCMTTLNYNEFNSSLL